MEVDLCPHTGPCGDLVGSVEAWKTPGRVTGSATPALQRPGLPGRGSGVGGRERLLLVTDLGLLVLARRGVRDLFVSVRVSEQERVFEDTYLCLRSRTPEPNAVISVRRGLASGPCSPPPSLLGFGGFIPVPTAWDATPCLLVLSRMSCPTHHVWGQTGGGVQLGRTLADF